MHLPRRALLRASGAMLAAPAIAEAALPQGTVRILVGFPPGGGTEQDSCDKEEGPRDHRRTCT